MFYFGYYFTPAATKHKKRRQDAQDNYRAPGA
jgi:hypothetical protein